MAYAAVVFLEQAMRDLLKISKFNKKSLKRLIYHHFGEFDSFLETIRFLPSIKIVDAAAASQEMRVKDAAYKLYDLIDSHMSDRLSLLSDHQAERIFMADDDSDDYDDDDDDDDDNDDDDDDEISRFCLLLSQQLSILKEEIRSFLTMLKVAEDQQQQRYDCSSSSSDYTSVGKQRKQQQQQNRLVGLDAEIKSLKEWICTSKHIPTSLLVVGMTGIGKTSLVKHVYNDPDVIEAFETRFFFHIGPQYTEYMDILRFLCNQLGFVVPSDPDFYEDEYDLKDQLSRAISSTKCLLVLDDVWADNDPCWSRLASEFPSTSIRNRVVIISHIQRPYYSWFKDIIILPLLKEGDSWKLLRQTAFTSEDKCSSEHEKFGKEIARNCEGLPAAILQVGENLRGKSIQEWKTLSENEDPLVITRDDDTPLSKALYYSYMMLPQKLRTIFLYMAVFPKNYRISRSMLIKLCVSERFVDSEWGYVESLAGQFLDQLVWRSVVLVEKKTSKDINKTKNCRLHFTFRSLCVNEAKRENLFHVLKKYTDCIPDNMGSQQRLCFHNNVVLAFREVHEWMESVPNARSFLCFGPKQQYPVALPLCFRLLKVLDALAIRLYEFPHQVLALFVLRYLAITCDGELPNSICRLRSLEVLIFTRHHNIKLSNNGPVYLPIEIWKMHQLQHLYCKGFDMPAPPVDSHLFLAELLTLSGVSAHSCTAEVLSRIPCLTRVAVQIESAHDSTETFGFFDHFTSLYDRFESFKCVVVNPNLRSQLVGCVPHFPRYITKISLSGCGFPWEKIEAISTLEYLVVLKLRWYAFCGPVWKVSNSQFTCLEFLLLEDLDIEHLVCDDGFGGIHDSMLNRVIIRHCYKLGPIGRPFGACRLVEVDDCSLSFTKAMREWRSIRGDQAEVRSSSTDL